MTYFYCIRHVFEHHSLKQHFFYDTSNMKNELACMCRIWCRKSRKTPPRAKLFFFFFFFWEPFNWMPIFIWLPNFLCFFILEPHKAFFLALARALDLTQMKKLNKLIIKRPFHVKITLLFFKPIQHLTNFNPKIKHLTNLSHMLPHDLYIFFFPTTIYSI